MTVYLVFAIYLWILSPVIAAVAILVHTVINKPQAEKYAWSNFWFTFVATLIVALLCVVMALFG